MRPFVKSSWRWRPGSKKELVWKIIVVISVKINQSLLGLKNKKVANLLDYN